MRRMVRPAFATNPPFPEAIPSIDKGAAHRKTSLRDYSVSPPHSKTGRCRILPPDEIKALNNRCRMDELRAANPWLGDKSMPSGYWESRDNRVAAIKVLVHIVTTIEERPMESLGHPDFDRFHLEWLLRRYYHSWVEALEDAGFKIEHPWLGRRVPSNYWQDKANRVKATKWLVARCETETKSIREMQYTDFTGNKLHGLLDYYKGSPFAAFLEAGLVTEEQRSSFTIEKRLQNLKLAHGGRPNAEQSGSLPDSERSTSQQAAQLAG